MSNLIKAKGRGPLVSFIGGGMAWIIGIFVLLLLNFIVGFRLAAKLETRNFERQDSLKRRYQRFIDSEKQKELIKKAR